MLSQRSNASRQAGKHLVVQFVRVRFGVFQKDIKALSGSILEGCKIYAKFEAKHQIKNI
jgi:hypothetical protein